MCIFKYMCIYLFMCIYTFALENEDLILYCFLSGGFGKEGIYI